MKGVDEKKELYKGALIGIGGAIGTAVLYWLLGKGGNNGGQTL